MTSFCLSISTTYPTAAMNSLRAAVPSATITSPGPATCRLEADTLDRLELAAMCRSRPLVFVRHLAEAIAWLPLQDNPAELARTIVNQLSPALQQEAQSTVALQIWSDGLPATILRPEALWHDIAGRLETTGITVKRAACPWVIAICLTESAVMVGFTPRSDALADWPGGQVRLAKPRGQISRSEFKLEELLRVADLELPTSGTALDLGASPGGWTGILRQRGLRVVAVDPAPLDPRLAHDAGIEHERTTAGAYLEFTRKTFDLIVNDMKMTPILSCDLMIEARQYLIPGGLAIMSLKLDGFDPHVTVERSLNHLAGHYQIVFARQLYHNRHEITIVCRSPHT